MQARLLHADDVPAGKLILWFPSKETQRATFTAPVDHRPLTADQMVHFDGEPSIDLNTEPSGVNPAPWIGLSCFLADATTDSIATTLSRYFDRHEIMRTVFDVDDFASLTRSVIPKNRVTFDPRRTHSTTAAENYRLLARHLARETRCNEWPYAGFATIHHKDGATLFAAFDHMVFDGYSMYVSLDEFPRWHAGVLNGDSAPDDAPSHADYALLEHTKLAELGSDSAEVSTWRNALTKHHRLPGLPQQTGVRPGEEWPHEFLSIPLLSAKETFQIRKTLKAQNASVGLGFLSGVLGAGAEQEDNGEISFLISTHNRPNANWSSAVGWFAGVVPITLKLGADTSHGATLNALDKSWNLSKSAGIIRIPEAARRLSAHIEPSLVVSYMEGTHAPGWKHWSEYRAQALLGPTPPGAQIHLWVSNMPDGLHLEVRYPSKPSCLKWIQNMAVRSREILLNLHSDAALVGASIEGGFPCK